MTKEQRQARQKIAQCAFDYYVYNNTINENEILYYLYKNDFNASEAKRAIIFIKNQIKKALQ